MRSETNVIPQHLIDREVDVYTTKSLSSSTLKPERLVIKIATRKYPLDFGSFCYSKRVRKRDNQLDEAKSTCLVDPSSLKVERRELVRGLIDQFITAAYEDTTIYRRFKGIRQTMEWIDSNAHCDFLQSEDNAANFYRCYVDHLYERIADKKGFSPSTAAFRQTDAIKLIRAFFGESQEYITRNIATIKYERSGADSPESDDVEIYRDVLTTLTLQLSKQLVKNDPFPLLLNFKDYSTYIFPNSGRNVQTPYSTVPFYAYNFDEGRICTAEEYYDKASNSNRSKAKKKVGEFEATLIDCNNDPNHKARRTIISLCMQSYAALFQLITGANTETVPSLEVKEAVDIANSTLKMDFSTVKMRANGKYIRLPIGGKHGSRILKEYLNFRKLVLNGKNTKYLFFNISYKKGDELSLNKLSTRYQSTLFNEKLRGRFLPSNFENISPSQVRKYKNTTMYDLKISPSVAADVLGHTESVNLSNYTDISQKKQNEEYSLYWSAVHAAAAQVEIIKKKYQDNNNTEETVVGACKDMGKPEPIYFGIPIEPDCSSQYGCLFCKHYCCHADKEDTHKLLSLVYVLTEVRHQAENTAHADSLLKELCVRARFIVKSISEFSKNHHKMVTDIEHDVFELGILTPFWERRLTRYEQMEIVL